MGNDHDPLGEDYDGESTSDIAVGLVLVLLTIAAFAIALHLIIGKSAHAAIRPPELSIQSFPALDDDGTATEIDVDTEADLSAKARAKTVHDYEEQTKQDCVFIGDDQYTCTPKPVNTPLITPVHPVDEMQQKVQERENERAIERIQQEEDESSDGEVIE